MNNREESRMDMPVEKPKREPVDVACLKKDINNVVWMYASPDMTLNDAEIIACKILTMILGNQEGR